MAVAIFIFTPLHDMVIIVAGLLALVTLIALFVGLYRNQNTKLLYSGIGCLLLMGLNNFVYFTGIGITQLAILQKDLYFIAEL